MQYKRKGFINKMIRRFKEKTGRYYGVNMAKFSKSIKDFAEENNLEFIKLTEYKLVVTYTDHERVVFDGSDYGIGFEEYRDLFGHKEVLFVDFVKEYKENGK